MATKEEAKAFIMKVWDSVWERGLATLPELFNADAAVSGYSPPKQTTWTPLTEIKAHFESIQPIVSSKRFSIENLDIVEGGNAYYATWNAAYQMRLPGQEEFEMPGSGILHCVLKDGKVSTFTLYEDPTPFVEIALAGKMGPPPA